MAETGINSVLANQPWLPGSFTKQFSWEGEDGLRRLHKAIRLGFQDKLEPVLREEFRDRIRELPGSDLIPVNFFLYNYVTNYASYLAVDELVFQALTAEHSSRFDKLATFTFNFSFVGFWSGATRGQRYPALWARSYIIDRLAAELNWDVGKVSANDIEQFLRDSGKFEALTTRKVATNLAGLYRVGDLQGFAAKRIERWWVDALFLALDRMALDHRVNSASSRSPDFTAQILMSNFRELAGPVTAEKTFAVAHLTGLYAACGDLSRFDPHVIRQLIAVELPEYQWAQPNDDRPVGAVHPTNPRILKTVPRLCSELATKVGFKVVPADELEAYDPTEYGALQVAQALSGLQEAGIKPTMSAEELHRLTRGE